MALIYDISKTIYNKEETLEVEYTTEDQSFSHEFGIQAHVGFNVVRVKVYVELMDKWVDVTLNYGPIEKFVNRLIEKDLGF